MNAGATRQGANLRNCGRATISHDVGGAEFLRERDAVRVVPKDNDLVGTQTLSGDDATQAHGPVANDGDPLAVLHPGDHGSVMPGSHDVG